MSQTIFINYLKEEDGFIIWKIHNFILNENKRLLEVFSLMKK